MKSHCCFKMATVIWFYLVFIYWDRLALFFFIVLVFFFFFFFFKFFHLVYYMYLERCWLLAKI